MPLPQGIPTLESYRQLIDSPLFREMADDSDAFLARSRRTLRRYAHTWVSDPMRQWSRRWEYPFCYDHLRARFEPAGLREPRVLDAGSGITFFPYFLASKGMSVACCDRDASLARIFRLVSAIAGVDLPFTASALSRLPYADASFDGLCCVSVLEHCDDHAAILGEFHRVLRPGGLLALTFDVSLDGRWRLPPVEAEALLRTASERFAAPGAPDAAQLLRIESEASILSTRYAQEHDPSSLPWGLLSDIKSLSRFRWPRRPHKALACCAVALTRI
jgi:SAM-dependent methyltransferase